jgi:uncharacterized membrane protein
MVGMDSLIIFSETVIRLVSYVPNIIAAVILLLVGWLIGKVVGIVTKEIMKKMKADSYFKFGRGFEVSKIFSLIVSWIIYLAFIQAAVSQEVLGIPTLETFVGQILAFIPGILEGMVIILVGYILAKYVQGQIIASKAEYSEFIGQVVFFFTIIITIALALPFVGINPELINNIILVLVASIGIGVAIALGLGLKETIGNIAKKYAKKV